MDTSRDLHCSSGLCMGVTHIWNYIPIILLCISQLKVLPKGQEPKYYGAFPNGSSWNHASVWKDFFISLTECRFYFSCPKAKGFDLSSYLVTNGDIWEVEYDAVHATELFSTQEDREDSTFEFAKMRREPIPN